MLKEMNATTISLIPKVSNSTRLKDFRPISCCNTVYKCIANILAGRIKVVLPFLVSRIRPHLSLDGESTTTFFCLRN